MGIDEHIPAYIRAAYEVHDYRHAAAILAAEFPSEFGEICAALRTFRLVEREVKKPGGNESDIPKRFSQFLRPLGWTQEKLTAKRMVDERVVTEDTHVVDYLKNGVAFDLEWNSKDQTFDRDLYAFGAFLAYQRISVGMIVTRSTSLDLWFAGLGTYVDKYGTTRAYKDKFGASTTHLGKLLPRLTAGRSGGCPVLAIGITPKSIDEQ